MNNFLREINVLEHFDTAWKNKDFCGIQILREINFRVEEG